MTQREQVRLMRFLNMYTTCRYRVLPTSARCVVENPKTLEHEVTTQALSRLAGCAHELHRK